MADGNNIPDISKEVSDLKADTKKDRNTIENVLKKADDNVRKRKQELFIEKLNSELDENVKQITSYDDLTVAQRRELETFEIPDSEVEKMIDGTAEEIQNITTNRNDEINNFEERITNLYKEAEEHINKLTEELNNKELKDEEREKIQNEINGWEKLMNDIGPEKGSTSSVRKELTAAIKNHDEARMNGVNGMALIYPKEKVYNNAKVKKIVPENQREQFEKQAKEGQGKDEQEQTEQGQDKQQVKGANGSTIPPEVAQKLAQQMAGQQGSVAGASQPTGTAVVGDDVEQEMDLEPDYLSMLGYNSDNVLDFENSSELLGKFANNFSDRARIEMLNDPECKAVILKALSVTGKNLSPKKSKTFNDTRDKLLRLAKGPMMEMALRDMGIENPENIKKEFNEANKVYNDESKKLEELLNNKELTPEAREELEKQKAELDAKYESVRNVADFQKSTNKIKTIRSRIISFKDAIMNKDSYTQTVKTLGEKAGDAKETIGDTAEKVKDSAVEKTNQAKDKVKEVATNIKNGVGDYFFESEITEKEARDEQWMSGLVKSQEERDANDVKNLEEEQKNQTQGTKNKNEKQKDDKGR